MIIAVFLAESPWGDIDDSAMDKGLGGRETALVSLSMQWAILGHTVYAFVPRSETEIIEHESGGSVRWIPNQYTIEITHAVQPDVFISWENVEVLKALTDFHGITMIEMQVAHLTSDVPVGDLTDYVCVLSEWAGDFFRTQHEIDPSRVLVLPNGVDINRFEVRPMLEGLDSSWNDYMHFIYSSSPDRGLHHLLTMWPRIQEMVFEYHGKPSKLHVCYGIESFVGNCRWNHREDGLRALTIEELITQNNIVYHGKIGQDTLAHLMLNCDAMLYPADSMSPTETGCISIVEAMAAGIAVVTTDCDCIPSEFGEVASITPLPLDHNAYVEAVIDALHPEDFQARIEVGMEMASERDWSVIAQSWIDKIEEAKNGPIERFTSPMMGL